MTSNGNMIYAIVVVNAIYKILVDKFFYLKKCIVLNVCFKIFKFWYSNFQTISDADTTYTKTIVLGEIQNFVIETLFLKVNMI
jgi:hypothetical protein